MYEETIEKSAIYIKSIKVIDSDTVNAFEISTVLSAIFDKTKEEVIKDIVNKVRYLDLKHKI